MRRGILRLLLGSGLIAAGIALTRTSKEYEIWYFAIVVGVIEVARGLYAIQKERSARTAKAGASPTE